MEPCREEAEKDLGIDPGAISACVSLYGSFSPSYVNFAAQLDSLVTMPSTPCPGRLPCDASFRALAHFLSS